MSTKIYGAGSEALPSELNALQDEYVDAGLTPWTAIGGCCVNGFGGNGIAWTRYGAVSPNYPKHETTTPVGTYLNPADYPSSHNGTLRTLQCRIQLCILNSTPTFGTSFTSVSLRSVSHSSAIAFTLGTALGLLAPGNLATPLRSYVFFGPTFTFPAAGLYTMEWLFPSDSGGSIQKQVHMQAQLQRRAI